MKLPVLAGGPCCCNPYRVKRSLPFDFTVPGVDLTTTSQQGISGISPAPHWKRESFGAFAFGVLLDTAVRRRVTTSSATWCGCVFSIPTRSRASSPTTLAHSAVEGRQFLWDVPGDVSACRRCLPGDGHHQLPCPERHKADRRAFAPSINADAFSHPASQAGGVHQLMFLSAAALPAPRRSRTALAV